MKLFVADADAYLYPDVMVTCDERDRRAELAIEHPKLVVEAVTGVLTPDERRDRVAAVQQRANHVGTDESRGPQDECPHAALRARACGSCPAAPAHASRDPRGRPA